MLFEEYSSYQTKVLDDLLDKISKNGVDSLTPEEKIQLKNIEDIKSPEVQKLLKNNEEPAEQSIFDSENIINKKYYDSTNEICFLLKKIENESTGVVYIGEIHFRYKIYKGYLVKDKETEQSDYKFISENDEEFDPVDYDLHYEFDGLIEEIFYDDTINKNIN
jgi:hypothetical protein